MENLCPLISFTFVCALCLAACNSPVAMLTPTSQLLTLPPTLTPTPFTLSPTPITPTLTPSRPDKFALWQQPSYFRGMNVNPTRNFVGDTDETGEAVIREPRLAPADLQALADLGANLVVASYPGPFRFNPPYELDPDYLAYLDNVVDWTEEAGLYLVIAPRTGPGRSEQSFAASFDDVPDYAPWEPFWFDAAARDKWKEMWQFIANRYADRPHVIGYDLMVEPHPEELGIELDEWYGFAEELIRAIRQVDTETPIIVPVTQWSSAYGFETAVRLPDERLVYDVHQYEPFQFTHQFDPQSLTVNYPGEIEGEYWDRGRLLELLQPVRDFQTAYGAPILLGEFGLVRWVPNGEGWLEDMLSIAEEYGWSYAAWVWRGDDEFNLERGNDPNNHTNLAPGDNPLIQVQLSRLPAPTGAMAQCNRADASIAASIFLRVNQVGYLPDESKTAVALTNDDLSGQTFSVVTEADGREVFTGEVGADRGAYGNFAYLYELDFSNLTGPGAYRLSLGGDTSPCFVITTGAYANMIPLTLQFFRVQRCGDTNPLLHGVCHREDGIAVGGPADGAHVDATGGWHDAGDYLKFVITVGHAANLMLTSYQRHPQAFVDEDGNGTPDVLDEVRIGLAWLLKMWDSSHGVLYYQVGDVSDHNAGWRMPEDDDTNFPPRPVWAVEPGKGANVAGRAAAALALAASLWNDPANSFYDPDLADLYLTAAQQIYDYGKARPEAQPATGDPDMPELAESFYPEESWQDDMALGAAELYRATGDPAYLAEARAYVVQDNGGEPFSWADVRVLAYYEIARLDSAYTPTATAALANDLAYYQSIVQANAFRAGVQEFYWGSAETMVGEALTALWYEDLSGDTAYHALAQAQRDYMLGGNPWGVSFVNGVGANWPHHPHHQVADLTGAELVGFWDEGPATLAQFLAQNITLNGEDIYAAFQSEEAVYHDDVEDYTTNEPTITMNGAGLAFIACFVAP